MSSSCPQCLSKAYKRNGYTRHGKQNHRCLSCGKQFSLEPYSLESPKELKNSLLIEEASSFDPYKI
jgi:transposase-like protein